MRILFLSLSYIPGRRASAVQVTRMCTALARAGHEVTLLAKRGAQGEQSDHAYYGVPETFDIVKLPRPRRRGGGALFAGAMAAEVVRRMRDVDLVYARDLPGAWFAARIGCPVLFEPHGIVEAPWLRRMFRDLMHRRSLRCMVVISHALKRDLEELGLVPDHAPTVVAHDAADVRPATPRTPRTGPPRIGYVGSLYPGRGIELILDIASREPAWQFDLVGGDEADLARLRASQLPANVVLRGFVPPGQLAAVYGDFDAVLMPYARSGVAGGGGRADTNRWCSPMKMFEYMASGVPIVASDLPVLQEVLAHGSNALIAPFGDVDAWRGAIRSLVDDPALAARLAATARADLEREHTWDARTAKILAALR